MDSLFKEYSDNFGIIRCRLHHATYDAVLREFPKKHPLSQAMFGLYNTVTTNLASDLDDVICRAYPRDIHYIPHTDTALTKAFYTSATEDSPFTIPYYTQNRKPKVLDQNSMEYIMSTLQLIESFSANITNNPAICNDKVATKIRQTLSKVNRMKELVAIN